MLNGNVRMSAQAQSMAQLADALSGPLERQVVDFTELKGLYDFHLTYMPDSMAAAIPAGAEPRPDGATDVFTSLPQQLGLKLEPRKGPVRMVYIDTMEKTPTEN